MKILILEDSPERIKTFKRKLMNHDTYFFDNVEEAKKALKLLGPFDIVFLDHDLDDRVFVNSNDANTGYQLAKYIAENNINIPDVIIHTMNPVGAENIKSVLPKAVICPFPVLFNYIKL